jgi:hypothetical protein
VRDYSVEKDPNTLRIITLGDSWVYGMLVNTEENFSSVLENLLNNAECKIEKKIEVINLGAPSYDVRFAVERFKMRGQKYDPDLIIWLLSTRQFYEMLEFLLPRREELKNQANDSSYDFSKYHKIALEEQFQKFGERGVMDYQKEALYSINQFFDKKLLLFSLSKAYPIKNEYKNLIESFVDSRKDTYYFEDESVLNMKEILPDGHPSSAGHAKIARNLRDYIIKTGIIPCSQ